MKLDYIGHACFMVTTDAGFRWITDPYDPSIGLNMPRIEGDVVTISHGHYDHNHIAGLAGAGTVLSIAGEYGYENYTFRMIKSYHDAHQGKRRGENLITVFSGDGLNICHLGDLGHMLDGATLRAIGPVDALMIPIGGNYTIDSKTAVQVVHSIMPRVVIPMHYKVKGLNVDIDEPDAFLKAMGYHIEANNSIELNAHSRGVMLMKPRAIEADTEA